MARHPRRRMEGLPHSTAGNRKPLDQEVGNYLRIISSRVQLFNYFIMRNKTSVINLICALIALLFSVNLTAQEVTVGKVQNGKGIVTNEKAAVTVLKAGLSSSATINSTYIDLDPQSGTYYLVGRVGNDKVTGKAIQLQPGAGGELLARSGPGLEVECDGYKCSTCIPKITNWKAKCVCEDTNPPSDMQCDMRSKIIISPW